MATTTNYTWNLPTVGGDQDSWGDLLNDNWSDLDALLGGVTPTEFGILDGATVTTAELNLLDGVTWSLTDYNTLTATAAELNIMDGVTATTAEINKLDGFTGTVDDLNYAKDLRATGVTATEFDYLDGVTSNIQTQINTIIAGDGGVPSGAIILWSGSIASIPSGWFLCDGSNGTPNLRDRFVVGAGSSYSVGATGGASTVALSTANMPAHTHTFSGTTSSSGSHKHGSGTLSNYSNTNGTYGTGSSLGNHQGVGSGSQIATTTDGAHTHTYSGTTSSSGSGSAHENRPPYYALAYIMKA
jgi:microcystin-dependent protein